MALLDLVFWDAPAGEERTSPLASARPRQWTVVLFGDALETEEGLLGGPDQTWLIARAEGCAKMLSVLAGLRDV